MDTNQFVDFVKAIKLSHLALGNKNFNRDISEKDAKLYRRSIFISKCKKMKITKDNIRVKGQLMACIQYITNIY